MCLWGRGSPPQPLLLFFSSSRCHRALQPPSSPPASPPLACRTASYTLDQAPATWPWMRDLQVVVFANLRPIFIPTQQKKRGRERGKTLSSAPDNASAASLAPSLPSPSPEQFMGSSCSLCLHHCLSLLSEEVVLLSMNRDVYGSLQ